MKKITYIIALVLVSLSCNDDFTTISPKGTLNDDILSNANGVDLLLTATYGLLDGVTAGTVGNEWWGAGDSWWLEAISNNAHKGSTNGDQADLHDLQTYNWSVSNPYFLGKWLALYGGVDRANSMINLATSIEGEDFSAQIAEARFLRGYFYFELQRLWGNVSYVSENDIADPNIPNTGDVWEEIETDFQFAIDNLPMTQDVPGRVNKMVATAYLGKALLYQGDFSEALTAFNTVIQSGMYELQPNFEANFTFAGKNGVESIFAIQFAVDDGATNNANGNQGGTLNFPGGGPFNSCCGFYQPSQDLVNTFQTNDDGLPLLDTYSQTDVANDMGIASDSAFTLHQGNLDPRLDFTAGRRGIDYNGFGLNPGLEWVRAQPDAGPYLPKKNTYKEGDGGEGQGPWGQQFAGLNYNAMRYADVLLMAAEAEVEAGSLDRALELVNMVRNRAKTGDRVKIPDTDTDAANYVIEPYTNFSSQEFARQAVRFERRLELSMEGHHFFDLRRWGVAQEVMTAFFETEARILPETFVNSVYRSEFDLFPIPLRAIDLSGNMLNQNTGF